jgi:hypothetical protein
LNAVDLVLQDAFAYCASDGQDAKQGSNRYVAAAQFGQTIEDAKQFVVRQIDRFDRLVRSCRKRPFAVATFESSSFVAAKIAASELV